MNYEDVLVQLYQSPISCEWNRTAATLGEFIGRSHVVLARRSVKKGLELLAYNGFDYDDYESIKERFDEDTDAYIASLSARPNRRANHVLEAPSQSRGYFGLDSYMRQSFGVTGEIGAILKVDRTGEQFVSIMRNIDDLREDPMAQTKFGMILPHLRRAIEAAAANEQCMAYAAGLETAFDALSAAIFLCTTDTRIIEMNTAAKKILDMANGIRVASGKLIFTDKDADAIFRVKINRADAPVPLLRTRFAAPRRGRLLPLWVTIVGNETGSVTVFVEDPERDFLPDQEILERVAALSPAQARAARLAADGFDTVSIARDLGVSVHTALTHLRRAMNKLECTNRLALSTRLAALKGITD